MNDFGCTARYYARVSSRGERRGWAGDVLSYQDAAFSILQIYPLIDDKISGQAIKWGHSLEDLPKGEFCHDYERSKTHSR